MIWERDAWQVVLPHGIVEAQGFVAVTPGVARALVLLDDDGRDTEAAKPGPEGDAGLSASNNEAIGLVGGCSTQPRQFGLPDIEPCLAPPTEGSILNTQPAPRPGQLFVAFEL